MPNKVRRTEILGLSFGASFDCPSLPHAPPLQDQIRSYRNVEHRAMPPPLSLSDYFYCSFATSQKKNKQEKTKQESYDGTACFVLISCRRRFTEMERRAWK